MLRTAIAAAQQLMRLELEVASGARNISPEIAAFMPLRLEKPSGLSIAEAALSEDLIKYNSNGTMAALSELTTRWSIYARAMTASASSRVAEADS